MSNHHVLDEYNKIRALNAWSTVYQDIERRSAVLLPCNEAKKLVNRLLNRYRNVVPFDHSRIVLRRTENSYINANLVTIEEANRSYILTQGPLDRTIGHFWLMAWEQESPAILMLNKLIENDQQKCTCYWPVDVGPLSKLELRNVDLSVELIETKSFGYFVERKFRIYDNISNESRTIIQFHYTTWPDFGVPDSPTAFVEFLREVRNSGIFDPNMGPPIVHCSAGIGRSGTFCLVDSCLVLIEKDGEDNVDIQKILLRMRNDRKGLIQTPDQLSFSYEAIIKGIIQLSSDKPINALPVFDEKNLDTLHCTPPSLPPRYESLQSKPTRPLPKVPIGEESSSSDDHISVSSESDYESNITLDETTPIDSAENDFKPVQMISRLRERTTEINQHSVLESEFDFEDNRKQQENLKKRKYSSLETFKKYMLNPISISCCAVTCSVIVYVSLKHYNIL